MDGRGRVAPAQLCFGLNVLPLPSGCAGRTARSVCARRVTPTCMAKSSKRKGRRGRSSKGGGSSNADDKKLEEPDRDLMAFIDEDVKSPLPSGPLSSSPLASGMVGKPKTEKQSSTKQGRRSGSRGGSKKGRRMEEEKKPFDLAEMYENGKLLELATRATWIGVGLLVGVFLVTHLVIVRDWFPPEQAGM